jgi:hypothetical protein
LDFCFLGADHLPLTRQAANEDETFLFNQPQVELMQSFFSLAADVGYYPTQ